MSRNRRLQAALGYGIAAACLVWVLHDFRPGEFARAVAKLRWAWVSAAVVFDVLGYVAQGWRWQLLLRPVGKIPVLAATQAVYVGLFTNEIVPLRIGELVRAYLVARRLTADFFRVLPSVAVERLFDSVWLAVAFAVTAIRVPLPRELLKAGEILGLAVLAGAAVFVYLVLRPGRSAAHTWMGPMIAALREMGMSAATLLAFAVSGLFLLAETLAFWLVMRAYGLPLSFWAGAAVFLIMRLGTIVPNAPANVGTYQFFTVLGLAVFGVEKTQATGFSLVVFALLTVPLWALGFWALGRSGSNLRSLREEIGRLSSRRLARIP